MTSTATRITVPSLYAGIIAPPGAVRIRRHAHQRPRWWEWMEYRKIRCPAGHHLPNDYEVDEEGSARLRCNQPMTGERGGCGLWVWTTRMRGSGHFVIEITERDFTQLARLKDASERLNYLGIFRQWSNVP
jgi:hypothetical protein